MGLKAGDTRINAGNFDQAVNIFAVVESQDTDGGAIRTPTVLNGVLQGSPAATWTAWSLKQDYQGQELQDALTTIGETWATFSFRYHPSRIYVEGMYVQHKRTSLVWEIRGVKEIDAGRKKVECTCRLIR